MLALSYTRQTWETNLPSVAHLKWMMKLQFESGLTPCSWVRQAVPKLSCIRYESPVALEVCVSSDLAFTEHPLWKAGREGYTNAPWMVKMKSYRVPCERVFQARVIRKILLVALAFELGSKSIQRLEEAFRGSGMSISVILVSECLVRCLIWSSHLNVGGDLRASICACAF